MVVIKLGINKDSPNNIMDNDKRVHPSPHK